MKVWLSSDPGEEAQRGRDRDLQSLGSAPLILPAFGNRDFFLSAPLPLLCVDVDRINPLELNAQFPYR